MTKVMIVDDNIQHLQNLIDKVKNIPEFVVLTTAKDGIEVLDYLRHKTVLPDIILLDIDMPLYDGISTMDFINTFDASIKVIGISSHFEKPLIDNMMGCGALGFINKLNFITTERSHYNYSLDIGVLAKLYLKML